MALDNFVGQFRMCPVRYWPLGCFWRLTRQGYNPTDLFRGECGRCPTSGRIRKHFSDTGEQGFVIQIGFDVLQSLRSCCPAITPPARRLHVDVQFVCNGLIVHAVIRSRMILPRVTMHCAL